MKAQAITALGLLLCLMPLAAQSLHGNCQPSVNVQHGSSSVAICELYINETAAERAPETAELTIEHVSAHCAGPMAGEIAYLALETRLNPRAPAQPSFIPLTKKPPRAGAIQTRYLASAPVSLYAGPGTKITAKLVLEPDAGTPLGALTACDVRFQGRLL